MGKFTWLDNLKIYLWDRWPCKIFGHLYKYEPMCDDKPPFEFEECSICGHDNPTFKLNKNGET